MTYMTIVHINTPYSYQLIGALTIGTIALTSLYVLSKYRRDIRIENKLPKVSRKQFKKDNIVEICVSDIESILNSKNGNADSVEICCDREAGGITPSIGLIQQAVELLKDSDIEVHVLIRPRSGNFCYSFNEFDVMLRDIVLAKDAGADGVVVGVLDDNGYVDRHRLKIIRELARDMLLTFHRAFDVCESPDEALETIINFGCDRLLVSIICFLVFVLYY